jgi:aconitate decarboxylase
MSLDLSIGSSQDLTLDLCTFLTNLKYEDIPSDVVHMAKASILNSIGCGLSSSPSSLPAAAKLYAALEPTSKNPRPSTVLAVQEKATVDDAAVLNGLMMTARFFDDTHLLTLTHPSGPPLAAIMAYAEAEGFGGKDFILAFVIGVEVGLALTKALGLGPYKKGWHLTGIVGSFSAAAAVSSLMKLDAHGMATALGHASSMSSGSRNVFATDTLIVHAGCGARNGILSARLASKDFGSTTNALEKWINLMSVAGEESHPQRILDLLQEKDGKRDWSLLENAFKPYPCGIVIHPLIDSGIEARKEILGDRQESTDVLSIVKKIEATVSPMTIRLCGIRHPQEQVQTLFSNYHGLSVGLIYGAGGIKQFSKQIADEPVVAGLRDRINLVPNEAFRDNQAVVKFWYTAADGNERIKQVTIDYVLGSLENPMTVEQLNAKFADQAVEGKLDQANISRAISQLWDLDKLTDIQPLMRLLVPSSSSWGSQLSLTRL